MAAGLCIISSEGDRDFGFFVTNYIISNVSESNSFIRERNVSLTLLSREHLMQSETLGKGISGAKKIVLNERVYVIKMQDLSPEFQKNLASVLSRNMPVCHSLVSESDDSFADFPRKEVLGVRIASAFGIEVPRTQLVSIDKMGVASLQEYLPQEQAVAMTEKVKGLSPADIELQSAIKVIFFHAITENIDGHYGNILLVHAEQADDDDDFNPDFKAIPIDFSLIFPRHNSVYPNQMNLVKKDFFRFFENKRFSVDENLRPLVMNENALNDPEIQSIAKDHELHLLNVNFRAMQNVVRENKGRRMVVSELFDKFVTNVVLTRSKA